MISSIRARLLLAFVLLVTAGLLLMARLVLKDVRPHTFGATEDSLAETAVVLASLVEVDAAGGGLNLERLRATLDVAAHRPLQARIYDLEKKRVELRVYVTDPAGHGGLRLRRGPRRGPGLFALARRAAGPHAGLRRAGHPPRPDRPLLVRLLRGGARARRATARWACWRWASRPRT